MRPPAPLGGKLLTKPFLFLSLLALIALGLLAVRMVYGLQSVTHLNNGYPWGIWVVLDIHFTAAVGCGGYVLAFVLYVMNQGKMHALMRPALLMSAFAYTLANFGAFVDIGRWWNFYQIMLPWNINLNSVMFEVAICMALYTAILWIEVVPSLLERWNITGFRKIYDKVLFVIIALGIVLPTMHQSGLGGLVVAAGDKISPLWGTPWISFLFLMTAIIIGFAIVVFEGSVSSLGFQKRIHLSHYKALFTMLRWILVFYLLVRFADISYRGAWGYVFETPLRTVAFIGENAAFMIPLFVLWNDRLRSRKRYLFLAAVALLLGGAALRFNALIIGFNAPAGYVYFPSVSEMLVSIGLLSIEVVAFMYIVRYYPILPAPRKVATSGQGEMPRSATPAT
jgi:Ni/Fe-hydrogenase subunit HybB-like protein